MREDAGATRSAGAASGARFGSDLNCTSQDFSASLTFTQPAAGALASCRAGETISIDFIAAITSSAPNRYDGGFFIGEVGNDPQINDATKTCSNALFPITPLPFQDADADICGDFAGGGSATLLMQNVQLLCTPAPGTSQLAAPYTLVFSNQVGMAACTAANVTANTTAKCVASTVATVTGVDVNGYVTITKATDPSGDPQSFTFNGSSTDTVTPSSFSLTDGLSDTFEVALDPSGGTRTLTISDSAAGGWDATASIACTTPSGGDASSYVSVDNATRTITATLDATDFGALCTVTNAKSPILTLDKSVSGGTASATDWTLSYSGPLDAGQGVTGDAAITNVVVNSGTYTLSESGGPSSYGLTAIACTGSDPDGSDGLVLVPNEVVTCTLTNTFNATADLQTVKTLSSGDATPAVGDTVTFLITVTNNGVAHTTNVSLTDSLPAGLTATAGNGVVSQGGYVAATGVWSVGTLANGASATLMLEGTVDVGQEGNTITNTTTAASTPDQNDPGTTGDDLTETVIVNGVAVLQTVKTLASGDATPSEGDTVTFLITVTNDGPDLATNVSLTDDLPADLQATAGNGAVSQGSYNAGPGVWTIGTLANGASATLTLEGTVKSGRAGSTIINTTTAASTPDQIDPGTTGDDLSESVSVLEVADVVTVKTLSSGDATPAVGDTVTYLITVSNSGPEDATNVVLSDSLPSGLTATGNNGTVSQGSYAAGVWSVGTLANGASATLTLEGTVDVGQDGNTITNTTTAASTPDQNDPSTAGNDLTEIVIVDGVIGTTDLQTVKTLTSGDATPAEGNTVTFLITVTNNGPDLATNVSLTDSLPAGLTATVNNGTVSQGSYAAGVWTVGTLANGASATLTLEGTVDVGQGGNTITNTTTAAVTPDQNDPGTTGDDLSESVTVDVAAANPQLTVVKTADDTTDVPAGQVVTYTYDVTNTGNVTISGVSVSDSHNGSGPPPVPGGETLFNDAAPLSDSTDAATNASWDTLAPGDTVRFTATYTVTQQDVETRQ